MRTRSAVTLLAFIFVAACAAPDDGSESAAEMAASPDEAALEQLRADYVEHYNLHHAPVVADLYADSAFALFADGAIHMDKAAIAADLEADMAMSPTLSLNTAETMVFGDHAVARGEFTVNFTPQGGGPTSLAGNYLTYFTRVDGTWKIGGVISNYNAPPPEGTPRAEPPAEAPPEDGTMKDLVAAYAQHYNLGHASVVAELYTDDAAAAFSNSPLAEGRAAIESALAERIANGSPQLTIHDVGTIDLADGWKLDGGWYEIVATPPEGRITRSGAYMMLVRRLDDGTWKIQWAVSNGQPTPAT
jgi:ketosteroid isomerase-like protein